MDFYSLISLPAQTATFTCDELIRCKVCFMCLLLLPPIPTTPPHPLKLSVTWSRESFRHESSVSAPGSLMLPVPTLHEYQPKHLVVPLGSSVWFECPPLAHDEHYLIYEVTRDAFERCSTAEARIRHAKPFLKCHGSGLTPQRKVLRISELNPFGRSYKSGDELFFITTSSGSPLGIDNMRDGACDKYAMRMSVSVYKPEVPKERYNSCLRLFGVQPECCPSKEELSATCAQTTSTTTPTPNIIQQAEFFLSHSPPGNSASSPSSSSSFLLRIVLNIVFSMVIRRLAASLQAVVTYR